MDYFFFIWNDNTLRYIKTKQIVDQVSENYNLKKNFVETIFTKNPRSKRNIDKDWYLSNWYRSPNNFNFTINAEDTNVLCQMPSEPILDFLIYCERLYIANRDGLYEIILNFTRKEIRVVKELTKVFDSKSVSISAKSGNILISTSSDGLFNSSLWQSNPNIYVNQRSIEDKSIKAIWSGIDFINYENKAKFKYYDNEHERIKRGEAHFSSKSSMVGQRRLKEIGVGIFNSDELLNEQDNISLIFNNNNYIFIFDKNGRVKSRSLNHRLGREEIISDNEKDFAELEGNDLPLELHSTSMGVVLEYFDKVQLIIDKKNYLLHNDEALCIRTFPKSFNYRNIIAISKNSGFDLCSICKYEEEEIHTVGNKL